MDAAQVQLKTLGARLAGAYPKTDKGWTLIARDPFLTDSQVREGLLLLLGAAGFVLGKVGRTASSLCCAKPTEGDSSPS
jgi:hypothetical protein